MPHCDSAFLYNHKTPFAISVSHGSYPKSLEDLDASHKDPTYELVTGTREAYFIKKLAGILSHEIAQSDDVRNIAALAQDSARELERNWRMASCISNVPVSTGYPYLPTMPTKLDPTAGASSSDVSSKGTEGPSVSSTSSKAEASNVQLKAAGLDESQSLLFQAPFQDPYSGRRSMQKTLGRLVNFASEIAMSWNLATGVSRKPLTDGPEITCKRGTVDRKPTDVQIDISHSMSSVVLSRDYMIRSFVIGCHTYMYPYTTVSFVPLSHLFVGKMMEVGSKVEYYSQTMKGWVLSYVKGVNPDGTYRLNTKKAADPRLIRPLFEPVPNVRPPLIANRTVKHVILKASVKEVERRRPLPGYFIVPLGSTRPLLPVKSLDLSDFSHEILSSLQIPSHCVMSRMQGFSGGQNSGIWFISNPDDSLNSRMYCLKVVVSGRKFEPVPSERENYLELLKEFPEIIGDTALTFPQKIFSLSTFDIFLMPVARGDRMAEVLSRVVSSKDTSKLQLIFKAVGSRLRRFHSDYKGTQHGDLQTSNIFIDPDMGVTFIDLGGMGLKSLGKSDVAYFLESIGLLAKTYGADFERAATAAFVEGYTC